MFNLFKKKEKKSIDQAPKEKPAKPNYKIIKKFEFENSHGFRGYKRVTLSIYNDQQCEKDIPTIVRDDDGEIGNAHIVLMHISGEGWEGISVYANGKKLGTFYKHDDDKSYIFKAIIQEKIDKVHVRVEDGNNVLSTDENGKFVINQRPRCYLFVHIIEEK